MNDSQVSQIIKGFKKDDVKRYTDYWQGIAPRTDEDRFWRFVFAFLSVHTSWERNVLGYQYLKKNWGWIFSQPRLQELIMQSGVGIHQRRTRGIWDFSIKFWENPEVWKKQKDEDWVTFRDRLAVQCIGLGPAKTAFALEMCYPQECGVVCLDTHMLQLYGFDAKTLVGWNKGPRYKQVEQNWLGHCRENEVPSFVARNIFWDDKQNQKDSRYWSHVLE